MATTILSEEKIAFAPTRKVLPMQALAETLRDDALTQARAKSSAFQRGADLRTLLAVPTFLDAFKHALARGIARTLAENVQFVQAVYTYDPSANPDSESGDDLPVRVTVHLLVLVSKPSAALEALILSLDQALTAKLSELPSDTFAQRTSLLDVNLLTEEDARCGVGYAALLSSVFAPPLRIWQR
ncbi:MAG: hypothetical protein KGJ80_12740 [Chloroflexota bacterium]|nr:hypothetical protein [Chloroflexota bacterium]